MTDPKFCMRCKYTGFCGPDRCCDYIMATGHMRGCPPGRGCIHYEPGKKVKSITSQLYLGRRDKPEKDKEEEAARRRARVAQRTRKNAAICGGKQRKVLLDYKLEHGYSNSDFGLVLGVSDSIIGKWLNEYVVADWELIEKKIGLKRPEGVYRAKRRPRITNESEYSDVESAEPLHDSDPE